MIGVFEYILMIGDFSLIPEKKAWNVFFCIMLTLWYLFLLGIQQLSKNIAKLNLFWKKISYNKHNWIICDDLKMVGFLLGSQCGYTKFPCFLCFWDIRTRAQHWIKQGWPARKEFLPGEKIFKLTLWKKDLKSFHLPFISS